MTQKTEFYKIRTFSQRLSAASDFIQSNMKVIFKNILILSIPFGILMGFLTVNFTGTIFSSSSASFPEDSYLLIMGGYSLVSLMSFSVMYGFCGSLINKYQQGELDKNTRISELNNIFSYSVKTFLLNILIFFVLIGLLLIPIYTENLLMVFISMLLIVFIIPLIILVYYPVYFEDLSIGNCISKGIHFGWKGWGTNFLLVLLVGIIALIIQYIFLIPFYFATIMGFAIGSGGFSVFGTVINFIGSFILFLGSFFVSPIIFVMFAFQYSSLREEEEGISLQAKIDNFESL